MLIPGKSYSRVKSHNSRVSIDTRFRLIHTFHRTYWAEAERGGGGQRGGRAIASRSLTPSPIAALVRSVDIAGSGMPETSQGRPPKPGQRIARPPCWALLNSRSTSQADGQNVFRNSRSSAICGSNRERSFIMRLPVAENSVSDRTDIEGTLR